MPIDLTIPEPRAIEIVHDGVINARQSVRQEKAYQRSQNKHSDELIRRIADVSDKYSLLLEQVLGVGNTNIDTLRISEVLLPNLSNPTTHIKAHSALTREIMFSARDWESRQTPKGRPRETTREMIVGYAHNCWAMITDSKATTTPSGRFGTFAFEFEAIVTMKEPRGNERVLKNCVPHLNAMFLAE